MNSTAALTCLLTNHSLLALLIFDAGAYSGISIAVRLADSSPKAAAAATAQVSDSSFTTGALLPGEYVITASHPDWTLAPAQIIYILGPESTQLLKPFTVTGYTLSGSVTSRSGPVTGVQVTLLSSDIEAAGCSAKHPPGRVEAADLETALSTTALCSVLTGQDGRYSFPGVPCGQYTLQATYPDTDSRFEIEPHSQAVIVGHSSAAVPEPFTVTGFSVQGRVVDAAGDGVAGVEIRVGRELKATTDLNGRWEQWCVACVLLLEVGSAMWSVDCRLQHFGGSADGELGGIRAKCHKYLLACACCSP
jgi:hypothetical protein